MEAYPGVHEIGSYLVKKKGGPPALSPLGGSWNFGGTSGTGDEIKILLIEDNIGHAILTQEMLTDQEESSGEMFQIALAQRLEEGIRRLERERFDLVLLDLRLPDGEGIENIERIRALSPDLPVVILTGSFENEETALEAVREGVQDYLYKDGLSRPALVRSIRYAIERNKIEKKLKESQSMLAQAEKMAIVGQLTAGVAHEVKNPLGIILQGVDFLGKSLGSKGGGKESLDVLAMIRSAVERAEKIIQRLLRFSHTAPFKRVPTEMGDLIESSLELVEKQLALGRIRIERDFQKAVCAPVDRNQLQQVFINIILNAVQAMPEGGTLSLKTSLDTSDKKESIVCEIGDTGIGISKENLHRVFEPFFTTKPPGSGTGLGLGISKSIVEAHGGSIDIISEEGKGTTLRVTLPRVDCPRKGEG